MPATRGGGLDIGEGLQLAVTQLAHPHAHRLGPLDAPLRALVVRREQRLLIRYAGQILDVHPSVHHRSVPAREPGVAPVERCVRLKRRRVRLALGHALRIVALVDQIRPAGDGHGSAAMRRPADALGHRLQQRPVVRVAHRAEPDGSLQSEPASRVGDGASGDDLVTTAHADQVIRIDAGLRDVHHRGRLLEIALRVPRGQRVERLGGHGHDVGRHSRLLRVPLVSSYRRISPRRRTAPAAALSAPAPCGQAS